jgi:hypothetical protein
MSHKKLIDVIKRWVDFSIENQEQLEVECKEFPLPDWNKGYLQCLNDIQTILKETK